MLLLKEAAARGEAAVLYSFEEEVSKIVQRCDGIGLPARALLAAGTLTVRYVQGQEYSAESFAHLVREDLRQQGFRMVMLDSTAGYAAAMRNRDLGERLQALCGYLTSCGATVILTTEVAGITGDFCLTEDKISHLADTVIFMRYLEIRGEIRRAIGVLKRRLGGFEETLREYRFTQYGLKVGRPLVELRGVLSGQPDWAGTPPQGIE